MGKLLGKWRVCKNKYRCVWIRIICIPQMPWCHTYWVCENWYSISGLCVCTQECIQNISISQKKMCKNTKNKYEKIKQEFCVRHTALWRHFHSYSNRALFWSHHFVYKCWLLELIIMLSESFSHEIAPKGKKAKCW